MKTNMINLGRKLVLAALAVSLLPAATWAAPQTAPPAQAGAPKVSGPITLTSDPGSEQTPSIGGNYLVYADCRVVPDPLVAACNIKGIDLTTRQKFQVSTSSYAQYYPTTDGTYTVWMDGRPMQKVVADENDPLSNFDVYGAKLSEKKDIAVSTQPKLQNHPRVGNGIAVWADFSKAKSSDDIDVSDIYMYNFATGQTTQLTNDNFDQVRPNTDGKTVVWTDYRNYEKNGTGDIYIYDIASKTETRITNGQADPSTRAAVLSGNWIVWTDYRNEPDKENGTNSDIYAYNLSTKQEIAVAKHDRASVGPAIWGNLVVWTDYRNGANGTDSDIYGFDLSTGQEFAVITGPAGQYSPAIGADPANPGQAIVVWTEGISKTGNDENNDLKSATISGFSGSGLLAPPVALPGTGSATFPETKKTVTGLFLDYWRNNGRLPQQGFPISDVMGEKSDLDSKVYTVQYFERAVFEYHPEITDPKYKVLLSQLGTFQYKKKYGTQGAPGQIPDNSAGSRLFPETGKRVGGRFLEYWTQNGGLAQQGLPLSNPFMEKSETDDKTYMVQYFERAVFELHPENAKPNDVLLSLLGVFQYKAKYQGGPGPQPQPTPAPSGACTEVPPSQNALRTAMCIEAGSSTSIIVTGLRFQPGEKVTLTETLENGALVGQPSMFTADSKGEVRVQFTALANEPLGLHKITMEGATSGNKAIAYVRVLPPK